MTTYDFAPTLAQATSDLSTAPAASAERARAGVRGAGLVGRFNDWLAVLITRSVGTTWAAYLFVLIALVSLPQAFAAFVEGDTVTGIAWFSQSFLQLVLLPIILVGQNVISTTQDARAQEAELEHAAALQTLLDQQRQLLEAQQNLFTLVAFRRG
ncbi:MAG: hypothetical protein JO352_26285 [Chloroflexi bacterium]|nr:hypothetical protein [Chloroflexota bacterium]MBV9599656.1 hypothetical protein [Chloroflexota bacterium]